MFKNKKAMSMGAVLVAVLGVVLLVSAGIALWPSLNSSLSDVSADFPLGSIFSNSGVIALAFSAMIILGVFAYLGFKKLKA